MEELYGDLPVVLLYIAAVATFGPHCSQLCLGRVDEKLLLLRLLSNCTQQQHIYIYMY